MKNRKWNKRKRKEIEEDMPSRGISVYDENLGTTGVKTLNHWDKPKAISTFAVNTEEHRRRKVREMRFASDSVGEDDPWEISTLSSSVKEIKSVGKKIVGTCTRLEKSYLRLTTFPKAQNVRPLSMLEKALAHVKAEYVKNNNFEWANDQLKSIRQDITVQGIRTYFCLEVYEAHARILLENGDLAEFNQCQSMIRNITKGKDIWLEHADKDDDVTTAGDSGGKILLRQTDAHSDEFHAYRLLYTMVQRSWSDFNKALGETPDAMMMSGPSCQHAIQVVQSVIHNNYRMFFRLYRPSPNLSSYLMDFLVKRVRREAYDRIIAAYRPTMEVAYFQEALHFENRAEATDFLNDCGAVYVQGSDSKLWVDCKETQGRLQSLSKTKSR